ncbi:MAG: hypothetical protein H6699_03185 [Myxococcales bacterium]|nr:hypothetical protein [Myxococcales bacterium]
MPRIAPRPQAGPHRDANVPPSKRAQRAALAIAFATLAACDATDADPADVLTLPDVAARVAAQALTDGAATCGPDTASVLAHWTFDGATSPVLDDGPDAHDGALTGGTLGVTGMRGGAIDCGGTAAIDFGAGPDWDRTSARTLAAWVNVPTGTSGMQPVFMKVGAGAAGDEGVWFGVSPDQHPLVLEYSATGFEIWQASSVLTTDTWHHIAFGLDDGFALAWVDGEVALAADASAMMDGESPPGVLTTAMMGCADPFDDASMLKIDDVWMLSGLDFSTVPRLMDGETQASALDCGTCGHGCVAGFTCELGSCVPATCGAELSAYWALDEGAGTVGADAVGATHAVGIGAGSSTGLRRRRHEFSTASRVLAPVHWRRGVKRSLTAAHAFKRRPFSSWATRSTNGRSRSLRLIVALCQTIPSEFGAFGAACAGVRRVRDGARSVPWSGCQPRAL